MQVTVRRQAFQFRRLGGAVGQGDWVSIAVADVRREVHKDIYAVLEELEARGWRLRRQGHKVAMYCPCGGDVGTWLRIDGTPKNPTFKARRYRRAADHCPDAHDLIR